MRFKPVSVQTGVRVIWQPIGEFIHVSAIYLGLALITALVLSFILPSMRQQSTQIHGLLLGMFQTYEVEIPEPDQIFQRDWSLPSLADDILRQPDATEPATPEQIINSEAIDHDNRMTDDLPINTIDGLSFSSTLAASIRGLPIPGISAAQEKALSSYISRKYKVANSVVGAIIRTVFVVGKQRNLDPQLLLAVIAIESRYNPFAESSVGAQGLMQVMTSVHIDKLRDDGGPAAIFNPIVNIRVGTQILYDCVRRRGSVTGGLACYVGATGPSDGGYGNKVLAERRRIALASGIPVKD